MYGWIKFVSISCTSIEVRHALKNNDLGNTLKSYLQTISSIFHISLILPFDHRKRLPLSHMRYLIGRSRQLGFRHSGLELLLQGLNLPLHLFPAAVSLASQVRVQLLRTRLQEHRLLQMPH